MPQGYRSSLAVDLHLVAALDIYRMFMRGINDELSDSCVLLPGMPVGLRTCELCSIEEFSAVGGKWSRNEGIDL